MSASLSKEYGFVVSSSADWALDLCTYPMSIMVIFKVKFILTKFFKNLDFLQIASGGICAALFGKWTMKVGTRASMVTGGTIFASAFALTGLGISMHSLPMIYAGNGKVSQINRKILKFPHREYVFHFQSSLVSDTVVRTLRQFKP